MIPAQHLFTNFTHVDRVIVEPFLHPIPNLGWAALKQGLSGVDDCDLLASVRLDNLAGKLNANSPTPNYCNAFGILYLKSSTASYHYHLSIKLNKYMHKSPLLLSTTKMRPESKQHSRCQIYGTQDGQRPFIVILYTSIICIKRCIPLTVFASAVVCR